MSYEQIKIWNISTSEKEIFDIVKAWLAISAAFAILLSGSLFSGNFYSMFIVSSITVGIGFLLHELGHKLVAQRYGCFAEFRSFDNMLIIAILLALFTPFLFAAPGAVMISGRVGDAKNGKISIAGPVVNLILALIFLIVAVYPYGTTGAIKSIGNYGFVINSWLALFNMIPVWNFDGAKVFRWSKFYYAVVVVIAFVFTFIIKNGRSSL